MPSSIYHIPVIAIRGVTSLTTLVGGSGYRVAPDVTFDSVSGGTGARAIATINNAGIVSAVKLTDSGSGYTSAPAVTIAPPAQGGTAATITAVVTMTNTLVDEKLITADITFKKDEFKVGEDGLIRVWFCLITVAGTDTVVSVTHSGTSGISLINPEKLNADNTDFAIKSGGFYRFDIPAQFGDAINISSSLTLSKISLLRLEKIIFGA